MALRTQLHRLVRCLLIIGNIAQVKATRATHGTDLSRHGHMLIKRDPRIRLYMSLRNRLHATVTNGRRRRNMWE